MHFVCNESIINEFHFLMQLEQPLIVALGKATCYHFESNERGNF